MHIAREGNAHSKVGLALIIKLALTSSTSMQYLLTSSYLDLQNQIGVLE